MALSTMPAGSPRAGQEASPGARARIGRLVVLATVLGLLPLALLASSTLVLATRAVTREARTRARSNAAISAAFVRQQMESLGELVQSYASRPGLHDALSPGDGTMNRTRVVDHLEQLKQARPGIGVAFLADPAGRLIDIVPATPDLIGRDFSYRDWYHGVTATGGPYVSEVYQSAATGNPRVVAAAAIIRSTPADAKSPPLAVIVAAYGLDTIQDFVDGFARAQGIRLTVTDQRGTVVGAPGARTSEVRTLSGDRRVAAALHGRAGLVRTRSTLSAYTPVRGLGWAVVADVPTKSAFAEVASLRTAVLAITAILAAGLVGGLVLFARSLRGRAEAEEKSRESNERYGAILQAANEAFIAIDEHSTVTAWNAEAERTFGWKVDEALGRSLVETIIPPEFREAHRRGLARFVETGDGPVVNQRIELSALHRDGHEFPVEIAIWPRRTARGWAFNAFLHDISDRKRAQAELASARDEALEASRLKSSFLANMSHEIRTPMNGVIGMTSLLLDTDLDAEQREFAETIRRSADALLTILNDILDFSKVEAGRLEVESIDFDLRTSIEEVAELLAEPAQSKGLELATLIRPDVPIAVRGDPGRLRQILTNLVSNAVKFTEKGEVVIRVGLDGERDGQALVRFEVIDTGIGIPADRVAYLFDPFSQADVSTTRRYGGTGLGLAITRQLVELMGGEYGVESRPGEGSTFWFWLPLAKASAPIAAPAPRADLRALHVLIVDDNDTNRRILEQVLGSWGIRVEPAESGPAALQRLHAALRRGDAFDLALLDFHMPDMNGLELAEAVRGDADLRAVRLVMLTSSAQRAEIPAAQEAGIDGLLTKPVRQVALFEMLATVMGAPATHEASPMMTAQTVREARSSTRAHLLLAEDNLVSQKVGVRMLEKMGHRVDVANNGREAVDAVLGHQYDAVLMDCQMPEMDGYDATREIRRREAEGRHTPIIAMTASAMREDQERCLAAGMDDYLAKPANQAELVAVVDRWVNHRGESAVTVTSPDDAVLDASVLEDLRSLDGDSGGGILHQLFDLFVEDGSARVASLDSMAAAGDIAGMAAVAHSLKGSAANLGARRLAVQCHDLEVAAKAGDAEQSRALVTGVKQEFSRAQAAMRAVLAASP